MAEIEMLAPTIGGKTTDEIKDSERPSRKRNPKVEAPSDFDDAESFLRYMRSLYDKDKEGDERNRQEMILDSKFVAGEQWDAAVKARREAASKPTLTINRLPAYVAQLVGNRRMNDIGIKIIPDTGGTRKVADIREGLIRNIQKLSQAQYAYDKAFEQQVIGGLGNFRVNLDYAHDDVFEQDITVASIPNPLAVVWDRGSVDPTGTDAHHVFITDKMPRREFKKKYPDSNAANWGDGTEASTTWGWDTSDDVQVVSFWRMRSKRRIVALMQSGTVEDVTDIEEETWFDQVASDASGAPMVREVDRYYAQMYLCTSQDILAGPYDLPITRVPVFRVPGWELFIEGDRIRWGMVRFLRDPQKLHNYWRSVVAEKMVGSPKPKWIASDAAVEGHEDEWRRSHLTDDPLLIWNGDSGAPPVRVAAPEVEGALIQEAGMASQDMRDVSNMHESSFGQQSNEVSGKAIMARQRVGETGTVIYQDNLNLAIEEAGKVINQLIPFVYDTPRMIKILGEDMLTEDQVKVNYDNDPESIDITCGKYSVSVTTGPSYTTRRVEAREEMMGMINAMPDTMAIAADKIVEAQDWPGSSEIARRLRSKLPAGMVSEKDLTDEEKAAAQQSAQGAQQQQAMQQQVLQLEMEEKQAKTALAQAQAQEAQARANEAMAKARLAEAQAAKAIADIDNNRVDTALRVAESLNPSADNGALQ